jgi:hypothetical protein
VKTDWGPRTVRSGPPTPAFEAAWQTNSRQLKAAGYSFKEFRGRLQVSFWQDLAEEAARNGAPADIAQAKNFLEKLRPGGPWVLTAIVPDGATTTITANTFDQVEAFVREHNGKRNLYYSVNPTRTAMDKKAAKTDIAAIEYVLGDLDPAPGETSEAAKACYLAQFNGAFEPKPTGAVDSGNGIQGVWRLRERIALGEPVDGKFPPEDQAKIDDIEARAATMMRRLGAKAGTQNIDRILRLPGTTNLPNAKKRREGRTECPTKLLWFNDASYPLEAFPPGEPDNDETGPQKDEFSPADNYESIEPDDPALAKLGAKWIGMLTADNYAADYEDDRSRAEMAFATAAMRAGIDDQTIARCLMDQRRAFGGNTRTSPERLLTRIITRAHEYADDPVLEQMNRDYAAGFISNKFRIAKFDSHLRYPLQKKVEFLSQTDFINGVIHPRVAVPKFNNKGEREGERMEPRGKYWLSLPGRSEFDDVTFQPGAPAIIELERDGRIHRIINTFSGFAVRPDHVNSEAKIAKYLGHIRENVTAGDEVVNNYILDWMADGVQHLADPGRSSPSLRGAPGGGKNVFVLAYGRLFGQHFLHATHRKHVTGQFNKHQAEMCLIFVDEALFAEIGRCTNSQDPDY